MKIEITSEENGFYIYKVGEQWPIKNLRENFLSPFTFQEDDIENLLGEKMFAKFQKGQILFNVTKDMLDFVSGQRGAKTKAELEMYND